jgi:leader peptidase (prepilin peptidase)/N-methyltransferase
VIWPLVVLCGVLGLAVGSFLNVVIWRVPRGESVVNPPSHCPSCDVEIAPRDNVPLLSWLVLRGRCRHCGTGISARYPLVELGTAALFVGISMRIGLHPTLPTYLYLAVLGVSLGLIDIDVKLLPNVIVLPSYAVILVLLAIAAGVDRNGDALLRALAGMAVYYGVFYVMALAGGMGFGDVKLAGLLGLCLGYLGWDVLAVGFSRWAHLRRSYSAASWASR